MGQEWNGLEPRHRGKSSALSILAASGESIRRRNRRVQLSGLRVKRLNVLQAHVVWNAVQEVSNCVHACPDLFEQRLVREDRGQGCQLFPKVIDQVALPEGGCAVG